MEDRFGIPERESESVEFKLSMSEIDSAFKSGSAMLNSSGGGTVYIGVRDDGEIAGFEIGDRTHDKLAATLTKLTPKYLPEIRTVQLESSGRVVLFLRFSGNSGLYRYNGRPYIRVGASNHELTEDQYQKRILEQFHNSDRWELKQSGLTIEDLDLPLLSRIVENALVNGRLIDPGVRDSSSLLQGLGLMTDGSVNNAGVALFGKSESLQQTFPQCKVRLARFDGITKNSFRDNRQFVGNIFDLLRVSSAFVAEHNPIQSRVNPDTIERTDIPLYNPEVIREALVNAFAHRDYAQPGGAVDVAVYDDRMEITSTGGLRFGLTVEDLIVVHQSRPWNQTIASVLQRQGSFESWGRGTIRMIELTRIAGAPDPVFVDGRHSFTVQLPRNNVSTDSALNADDRILAVLSEYGLLGLSEIVDLLNWTGSRRQLQEVLVKLRTAHKIEVVGKNRGAKWRLINTGTRRLR